MEFSFGIITGGIYNHSESLCEDQIFKRIHKIIESIKSQSISKFEIIIVGGDNKFTNEPSVRHFNFDENHKNRWITKKKNIVAREALYENIVFMHDYVKLDDNWYKGMLEYGKDFDVLMTRIRDHRGNRYRDWILLWSTIPHFEELRKNNIQNDFLLPYDISGISKYQYISGTYWIAKKNLMEKFPLNEDLCWGQGEDIEWSNRVKEFFNFSMNQKSSVTLLKNHEVLGEGYIREEDMEILKKVIIKNNSVDGHQIEKQ